MALAAIAITAMAVTIALANTTGPKAPNIAVMVIAAVINAMTPTQAQPIRPMGTELLKPIPDIDSMPQHLSRLKNHPVVTALVELAATTIEILGVVGILVKVLAPRISRIIRQPQQVPHNRAAVTANKILI